MTSAIASHIAWRRKRGDAFRGRDADRSNLDGADHRTLTTTLPVF